MKKSLKILILGDSHSTDYGTKSYINFFPDNWHVVKLTIPGKSIFKIENRLSDFNCKDFDIVIIQLGNPDVHPRIKKSHIDSIEKLFGFRMKQQWFSLPERISFKFFFKIPVVFLKRIYVIFFKESYSRVEDVVLELIRIKEIGLGGKYIILPPFFINEFIYGSFHNDNVKILRKLLIGSVISDFLLQYEDKRIEYLVDGFHLNIRAHKYLAKEILRQVEG